MLSAPVRPHFHSVELLHVLSRLGVMVPWGALPDFARQLGDWVDVSAASQLFEAVQARPRNTSPLVAPEGEIRAQAEAARQAALVRVEQSFLPSARRTRLGFPALVHPLPDRLAEVYPPFKLFHSAHQREMQQEAARWRERLRASLAAGTPAQRQLAELDEVMDRVLEERSKALLARVPDALALHFAALRRAAVEAGDPSDRWFDQFGQDLCAVLKAEVGLVWQPLLGLMAAWP